MGLMDFIKNQLIDVIEWTDESKDTMVWRYPRGDNEIKMGAQLTVRESQAAVFVNEGKIADVFAPGRHKLSTENMPVLTTLKSWYHGFNSPFKCEVYFVNTKQFTDQKWGTPNPIMVRDAEFGPVRLRAFGIYSFKVSDPALFLKEVFGTNQQFSTEEIAGQLKKSLVSGIADIIGESRIPILDLAANYDEFGKLAMSRLQERFLPLGLSLQSFFIENISLPEEVEKVLDKRSSMGILGNLNAYTQYQSAEAIRDAAKNEGGGLAGAGIGLGAGVMMGNVMMQNLQNQNNSAPAPVNAAINMKNCQFCQMQIPADAKFCSGCGKPTEQPKNHCLSCKAEIPVNAKYCSACGASQSTEINCPDCQMIVKLPAKFCPGCGKALS